MAKHFAVRSVIAIGVLSLFSLRSDAQWSQINKGLGTSGNEPTGISVDKRGNVSVIANFPFGKGAVAAGLARYSPTGTPSPGYIYADTSITNFNAIPTSVAHDSSSNALVVGYSGTKQFFLKVSPTGTLLTKDTYSGPTTTSSSHATSVTVNAQDEVFVAGFYTDKGSIFGYTLTKYTATGQRSWVKSVAVSMVNVSNPIVGVDNRGFVYVGGTYVDRNYSKAHILKYATSNGALQWTFSNQMNSGYNDLISFFVDTTGNCYYVGNGDQNDVHASSIDTNAKVRWISRYGSQMTPRAATLKSDGIYICGGTGDNKGYAVKFNINTGARAWAYINSSATKFSGIGVTSTGDTALVCTDDPSRVSVFKYSSVGKFLGFKSSTFAPYQVSNFPMAAMNTNDKLIVTFTGLNAGKSIDVVTAQPLQP